MTGVAVGLSLCLFGDCPSVRSSRLFGGLLGEIGIVFRDVEMQWMVFLCGGIYFATFTLLQSQNTARRFWRVDSSDGWLIGALLLGSLLYASNYSTAVKSTQALTLLGGATLGKGAVVWAKWTREQKRERQRILWILVLLIVMLGAASLWRPEMAGNFQYRGQVRWSGPWDNPNVFGMLMGVGMVLAVGQLLCLRTNIQHSTSNVEHRTLKRRVLIWGGAILFLSAAVLMGIGLVKSYSRGAWLGTATGLAYLLWQWINHERNETLPSQSGIQNPESRIASHPVLATFMRHNWVPLLSILVSLLVLAFWNFRHTERAVARRAFSVGNVNDFSWRNRLAAYEGALQMMADKPWFGFGWNQPERMSDQYYRPAKVSEGMAIQLNDYFMLGMTLGIPALACFLVYVGLALTQKSERQVPDSPFALRPSSLHSICRAGVIVLLVGFWFDGGLFKLATAAPFWILLELGAIQKSGARSQEPEVTKPEPRGRIVDGGFSASTFIG